MSTINSPEHTAYYPLLTRTAKRIVKWKQVDDSVGQLQSLRRDAPSAVSPDGPIDEEDRERLRVAFQKVKEEFGRTLSCLRTHVAVATGGALICCGGAISAG